MTIYEWRPGLMYHGEYTGWQVPDGDGECVFYASKGSDRRISRIQHNVVKRDEVICIDGAKRIFLSCGYYGKIDTLNRLSYIGEWKEGRREGHGKLTWKDRDVYVGEFKANTREGRGTYTWANGASYEGQWRAGNRYGNGKCKYPDGSCYEGQYLDGLRDGLGKVTFQSGDTLKGEWKLDRMEGSFACLLASTGKSFTKEYICGTMTKK